MEISEEKLLKEFLEKFYPNNHSWTNCVLGEVDDWKKERMRRVTRKRADGVVYLYDHIEIIEAKLKPKAGAVGQLLLYKKLFKKTAKFKEFRDLPINLIFLTTRIDEEIKELCEDLDIIYKVFTPS